VPNDDVFLRTVKAFSYREPLPAEVERSVGWTGIGSVLDTEFTASPIGNSGYRMLSLRIDRRSIPAAVMKMRCLKAEQELLVRTGQKRLYREQRYIIRESVCLELAKTIPLVPRVYDVIWAVDAGDLYLGSLSPSVMDAFTVHFHQTFGLMPFPANPFVTSDAGEDVDPLRISQEFLTWLWFKSEERAGVVSVRGIGDIVLRLIDRVELASGNGEYAETVVITGRHSDMKEAREAVRLGKLISQARIRLERDGDEYEFTVPDNGFQYRSMSLPFSERDDIEQDAIGMALERIHLISKAVDAMDCLRRTFLDLRRTAEWQGESAKMRNWAIQEG
jgi:recombination associated protein RdgC